MERRINKIVRIRFANQMMTLLEASQSGIWNSRRASLLILWFTMTTPITGALITITDYCDFFTNLINIM